MIVSTKTEQPELLADDEVCADEADADAAVSRLAVQMDRVIEDALTRSGQAPPKAKAN